MVDTDFKKTTTGLIMSDLDYSTPFDSIDQVGTGETTWSNDFWAEGLGLYNDNPAYKEPMRAIARWTVGLGWETQNAIDEVILNRINGSGEDSFQSLMTNHIITMKGNGDAYMEIIRNEKTGTLINLKPIDPSNIKVVWNEKRIISHYLLKNAKGDDERREVNEIFHSMNDRITSQIHGTPAWRSCKWELEAKKEAMEDWRRISHLSSIRILYIDVDDETKLTKVKTEYKEGIKNGSILILPVQKKDAEFFDLPLPPIDAFIRWMDYLDNRILQALSTPRPIVDVTGTTEASSKVGFMTYEPNYVEIQTLLEQDIWNQIVMIIKFNRPPSLTSTVKDDETKNTGQTSIQPNEVQVSAGRTE